MKQAPEVNSSYIATRPFRPHPMVQHGLVQTLLAQSRPSTAFAFLKREQPILLDAGPDHTGMRPSSHVRLLGYLNHSTVRPRAGLS